MLHHTGASAVAAPQPDLDSGPSRSAHRSSGSMSTHILCRPHLVAFILFALGGDAVAQSFSSPYRVMLQDGQAIYEDLCQGCHMAGGQGAVGAGFYPALAHDEKLAAAGYAVSVVAGGMNGMPPMSFMLDDEQIAAVINYVRTHFGNDYGDAVTAADVKAARGK